MSRRILFVDGLWVEKFGIMSLIPHLEQAGFAVSLLLTRNVRRLLDRVRLGQPDYVAFSVTTGYHAKALEMARAVKSRFPAVRTIFGGPHVTYYPESGNDPAVDLAFRGECDRELAQALSAIEQGADHEELPNCVGNQAVCHLNEDLDSLPFPDREHFYRYRFFRNSPYKSFIVSRGCPYDCSFCFNHKLRDMYRGKGKFLRLRSPESVVEEGIRVRSRWGMKLASFEDDLITWDKKWLERLLTRWKSRVAVRYNLNSTARDLTDPHVVQLLKETSAWCVAFGVECGDEDMRTGLLNKPILDEMIREAAARLKEAGIHFLTYNMFALPGETFAQALRTIRLNRSIGTRWARCTLFQPHPGTQLGDSVSKAAGGAEMAYHTSPLPGGETRKIEKLQKLALVGMSSALGEKAALLGTNLPGTALQTIVFWATYFEVVSRYMQTGRLHLFELGVRSLTDLF